MSENLVRETLRAGLVLTITTLIGACGDSPGGGTRGELSEGTFHYNCVLSGDATCSETDSIDEFNVERDLGTSSRLPAAVAVGSRFGLSYAGIERGGEGQRQLVVMRASMPDDEVADDSFIISQPAEAAFLALNSADEVVDFVVVEAVEATELALFRDQERVEGLTLEVGDSDRVTAAPSTDDGQLLAGAIPFDWSVGDSRVAQIGKWNQSVDEQRVKNGGDIKIVARSVGKTTLRIISERLSLDIPVEVKP